MTTALKYHLALSQGVRLLPILWPSRDEIRFVCGKMGPRTIGCRTNEGAMTDVLSNIRYSASIIFFFLLRDVNRRDSFRCTHYRPSFISPSTGLSGLTPHGRAVCSFSSSLDMTMYISIDGCKRAAFYDCTAEII